ncbi:hypothetical protein ACTWQL_00660 [Pseudalkalibacillus sp. R45]
MSPLVALLPQESPFQGSICAPASTRKSCRSELPRRIPCQEIIQVVGTLIPQDKESFGSVTSHEENAIFIFE